MDDCHVRLLPLSFFILLRWIKRKKNNILILLIGKWSTIYFNQILFQGIHIIKVISILTLDSMILKISRAYQSTKIYGKLVYTIFIYLDFSLNLLFKVNALKSHDMSGDFALLERAQFPVARFNPIIIKTRPCWLPKG